MAGIILESLTLDEREEKLLSSLLLREYDIELCKVTSLTIKIEEQLRRIDDKTTAGLINVQTGN